MRLRCYEIIMQKIPGVVIAFSALFGLTRPATAQFDAIANINVTGSGLVSTESDYVPNVVKCENGLASFEALKAQAVAARTFAYYKMDLQGFINDGTNDQVYSCAGSAGLIHHQAAQATEGEILYVRDDLGGTQQDVLIASFYVAGAIPSGPFDPDNPGVIVDPGDSDPTSTEQWVTYTYDSGVFGRFNLGTPLGWQGSTSNPNWPNRGAKSQNGADYLSDNSTSYLDILKYYYGADIQLRTATTAGTGVQYGLKTLVNFDDYSGSTDPIIPGHEGTFFRSPTFSGSTTANVAGSTASRSSAEAYSGTSSQLLDIAYDEGSGTDFLVRHVSGSRYSDFNGSSHAADRVANVHLESIGSIGFWLKTGDANLQVSIAIDDPTSVGDVTSTERGVFKSIVADNQWRKYEWFLDEASDWDAWVGSSNGQIDAGRITIDSIQFTGASDAQIYLDDIFWDPQAVFVPPIPGDFDGDGDVDNDDLNNNWEQGFGMSSGASTINGDADGDGDVDGADLLIWQSNFGTVSPGVSAAAVPEPTSVVLAILGLTGLVARRRTKMATQR